MDNETVFYFAYGSCVVETVANFPRRREPRGHYSTAVSNLPITEPTAQGVGWGTDSSAPL